MPYMTAAATPQPLPMTLNSHYGNIIIYNGLRYLMSTLRRHYARRFHVSLLIAWLITSAMP